MERYALLTQLQQDIRHHHSDLKAESLLAMALNRGFTEEDFVIAFDGLFSRPYRKDVLSSAVEEDAGKASFLQLRLSRSGLHDQVPEGVFYQPPKTKRPLADAATMAADYKRNKQQEAEIRRFFMPFENAFFGQRLALEREETQLLEGLHCGILNEYFMNFWGISPAIPQSLMTPLIELLPYAHKIAGNLAITTQCLEKILQEKVSARKVPAPATRTESGYLLELGFQQLGMDMVIGEEFKEDFPQVEFTIGPLKNSQLQEYLAGGNKEAFLSTFYSFFMPVEAGVITRIEIKEENQHMTLSQEEEPVLGYSSVLN